MIFREFIPEHHFTLVLIISSVLSSEFEKKNIEKKMKQSLFACKFGVFCSYTSPNKNIGLGNGL